MIDTLYTCPRCKAALPEEHIAEDGKTVCPSCRTAQRHLAFPLVWRPEPTAQTPIPVQSEEEAHCAFHEENRAESPCDSCGRYICAVCALHLEEKTYCPTCLEQVLDEKTNTKNNAAYKMEQVRYDVIILYLAFFPILTIWLTIFTAPIAFIRGLFWIPKVRRTPECKMSNLLLGLFIAFLQIIIIAAIFGALLFDIVTEF